MKLAIYGGKKVRYEPFPAQKTITEPEKIKLVERLMSMEIFSGFRGNYTQSFWGGEYIRKLEEDFIEKIGAPSNYMALAVNSCTSALQIACKAVGISPGDEVIVTPWSMSCSATAPLLWGGVPVFADIEEDCFCLDPKSVKENITDNTKAIIAVDLFGQPFAEEIMNIAEENGLYVIEDAAQAIGSSFLKDGDRMPAGTIGDIGCYSFTQGKHLTAGEGGMIVTKDFELYAKCAMLRNHAEAVNNDIEMKGMDIKWRDLFGFNMRMTELQAAILLGQLENLEEYVCTRQENAYRLRCNIKIPGIKTAIKRKDCTHSYYVMAFHYDEKEIGVPRDKFINAVKAELTGEEGRVDKGVPINNGYIRPLCDFPIFQGAYFKMHYDLPVVRRLQEKELFITLYQGLNLTRKDGCDIQTAFEKVYHYRREL